MGGRLMRRIDKVERMLRSLFTELGRGASAGEVADKLSLHRANVSGDLNNLCSEGKVRKGEGRPVLFYPAAPDNVTVAHSSVFDDVIGSNASLAAPIQQAKAAMLYPPFGLHALIFGQTGVGKTLFADLMYRFGKENGQLGEAAPFISFNCSDYAKNPQLLTGQIFGVAKGAFTGADANQTGMLEKADGGILFLDEVHRLPPEGQEMLFTFIDKGQFRRLGEAGEPRTAQVLIICATTENPKSALLNTFTRRISMVIHLPPLRERSMEERLGLVNQFFLSESARINLEIGVSRNAMLCFMLYNCVNNVGQLRSDIQLSCARAFLEATSSSNSRVYVYSKILPEEVRRGSLGMKFHHDEMDRLLGSGSEFVFSPGGLRALDNHDEYVLPGDFYGQIEQKLIQLREGGLAEDNINELISSDIDEYFRKLISRERSSPQDQELERLVGSDILDCARGALGLASKKLIRPEIEGNLAGLALHISATRERLLRGKSIYNPKLNEVRKQFSQEFTVAIEAARLIEDGLQIELPIDEIGFITMFFVSGLRTPEAESVHRVGLLVLMHGPSAATSIVSVVNTLMNSDSAQAIDMPLDTDPETIFQKALKQVKVLDQGRGVLLMADMGSLLTFGQLITQETGVPTKTIPMVSTPMVLEAVRKIDLGQGLDQVYNAAMETRQYFYNDAPQPKAAPAVRVIVAACYTGQGSSQKIGSYLMGKMDLVRIGADVVTLDAHSKEDLARRIQALDKQVLAVVGMVNPELPGVPFLQVEEVLAPQGLEVLAALIERERVYDQIADTLASHLSVKDSRLLVTTTKEILERIHIGMGRKIDPDVLIGAMLHVGCMVERLVNGEFCRPFPNLGPFLGQHGDAVTLVRAELRALERMYGIRITDSEVAYIVQMVLECPQE